MRISDWSSDVCSSDLPVGPGLALPAREILRRRIIVGGEERVEAARPDVDEPGLHGADQFAHVREPAGFIAGIEQAPGLMVGDFGNRRLEIPGGVRGAEMTVMEAPRSAEHTSELQSLMRISNAVF